ncbi:asparagine synthase (glutamine-hydrolyzing) [Methylocystis heyeri]|uniref:asparagine synthase (glutamine-hydrolyzing) n=1 Tax=Methylocystis heyeri TaxID=391905 RepID=A0A6B8KE09_9HYPH|nr:asparagine synthase (glutamine-hydrolyzing) [Methylocystis heyeri]QGM45235.1 asparagine synthase (glutamine-hydrolyzing) [Methylocystis heyeri]
MCGLAGFIAARPPADMKTVISAMADSVRHRGPDDEGAFADAEAGVALGFRRLAIVDLSAAGRQPMHSACGRYVLVFNGEVYNHRELRAVLEQEGCRPPWRGHSDTETLLAGFAEWGVVPTLERAVGMFAFALWDRIERRLTLGRDRFGEKPLYYGWVGQGAKRAFAFGSELKALRAYPGFANPVSRDALGLYLQYSVVPAPYSIYEGVFKLAPASLLTLRAEDLPDQRLQIEPYWNAAQTARQGLANPFRDENEALSLLEAALHEAVGLQSVADAPLGAFLSGGVDSSMIVALMQAQSARPVQTFTVGFDEAGFDESPHALAVARHLGSDHHELRLGAADARAVIPLLPRLYDEPFADSSQIPTYLICKAASRRVTVALSGDAGDEHFGGYNRYIWARRVFGLLGRTPPALRRRLASAICATPSWIWSALGSASGGVGGVARLEEKAHKLASRLQNVDSLDDFYRSLVKEWPDGRLLALGAGFLPTQLDDAGLTAGVTEPEHRMMLWDSLTYLPDDILTKVDRAAMGVSLETRAPFLDHRVVELAWRLPLHMKIRDGQGKWALRQLLYKYVPRELIERPKAGFSIPLGQWLRGPLRDWAEDLLEESRLDREGYLDAKPIREAWGRHLGGRRDCTGRLWSVLMFQAWLEANS